jgi:hypothetical protein
MAFHGYANAAALFRHIPHVLLIRAEEQVGRVNALPIVAGMANEQSVSYRAFMHFVTHAVRPLGRATAGSARSVANHAVASGIQGACPIPAGVGFVHHCPEPLLQRWPGLYADTHAGAGALVVFNHALSANAPPFLLVDTGVFGCELVPVFAVGFQLSFVYHSHNVKISNISHIWKSNKSGFPRCNQANQVCIAWFPKNVFTHIRRCPWKVSQPANVRRIQLHAGATAAVSEA